MEGLLEITHGTTVPWTLRFQDSGVPHALTGYTSVKLRLNDGTTRELTGSINSPATLGTVAFDLSSINTGVWSADFKMTNGAGSYYSNVFTISCLAGAI